MTTLITGATGFVGSAVVRLLLQAGHSVRALVRPTSRLENIASLNVETVVGDLTDQESMVRALQGCSALFHVAADYRLWVRHPASIYRNNVEGTRNLLLAAHEAGVKRIVYTSSVATLGLHHDGTPADEDTPVTLADMIGHYKRSKYLAEEEVRRLVREKGVPVVTVNPSAPIGPRDIKPTPTGQMILDAACGRMPAFVDTGLNVVHVDDVAEGHLLAFDRGKIGERYILGGTDMSLKDILGAAATRGGRRPPRVCLPHNLILPIAYLAQGWARVSGRVPKVTVDGVRLSRKHMYFSVEKAKSELGYEPRPAVEALDDAVAWFQEHRYFRGPKKASKVKADTAQSR